ncbi:MAG: glycerol kinase GlpK [Candidatus Bipolaricaulaceae bacterium]
MKRKKYLAALDAGTTGVRFLIVDETGQPQASAYRELPLTFPQPGWVEQDPWEILSAARQVIHEALEKAGIAPAALLGFGLTNQRETVVVWDKTSGKPLSPAIVWQDRRTAPRCAELKNHERWSKELREKTGLLPDPYFSATKLEWLLSHGPLRRKAQQKEALVGTVDSWLLFSLTGEHATDPTNASRTLLFDIHRLTWDEDLCELFGVPQPALPEVFPSLSVFGRTKKEVLGMEVPVAGILGDQQSALFGQACFEAGQAKITWGTGAFFLVNTGEKPLAPPEGVLATVAYTTGAAVRYALEGSIFMAGATVQWLRDGLGLIQDPGETERLAQTLSGNDGVYFVPALVGLGAPHWDPYARGVIVGLTRGTTRAHLARAALEAIAYQTHDLMALFQNALPWPIPELRVDGGAARNNFLCQFQADILARPVVRPRFLETTALGAAFACGCALGLWDLEEIRRLWQEDRRFTPSMPEEERRRLIRRWQKAVARAKGWEEV